MIEQRRRDRIERLRERMDFLRHRLQAGCSRREDRDKAEISALAWVLEELDRFDLIEQAIRSDDLSQTAKLIAIGSVVHARYEPSDADIQRTKQLQRLYGEDLKGHETPREG